MTSTVHTTMGSRSLVAPYITTWSAEIDPPASMVVVPGVGVGYADERAVDRGSYGILWQRAGWRPGEGRPVFGRVHPIRQRRAMRKLLCQVCGGRADQTDDGVLWLLQDHRDDWPGWPNRMGVTEPPICRACVPVAVRLCPALRKGAVAVRAGQFPLVAVRGCLYTAGPGRRPIAVREGTVPFDSPMIRWVRASNLVRELTDCTLIEVNDVAIDGSEPASLPNRHDRPNDLPGGR